MKKPGQPDNALEITTGRRCILIALKDGVAQRAEMSMAANWLRDLYTHHRIPVRCLEGYEVYRRLMAGVVHDHATQKIVLTWINDLVDGNLPWIERDNQMPEKPNEDELISQGRRESLSANSRQVGGSHYQKPIQHWDFVAGHDYGYLAGQVTKYLFRWRDKNGLQDVQKASHFLQKLIEIETQHLEEGFVAPSIHEFLTANGIPEDEAYIMTMIHAFSENRNLEFLELAKARMTALLARAGAPHP